MKTPTGVEYKQEVIKLFKSGEATEEQWHQMSAAVLEVSLSGHPRRVEAIDYSLLFEEHLMAKTGRSINTVIAEVQAGRDRGGGVMGLYRKKVIVVSAEQWRPEDPTAGGVVWNGGWGIQTLEGFMHVSPGDWIITGIKGEKYPCKPDIFEATYEPVERDRGEG